MLRFFALLTGDRHSVLRTHTPASRKKVVAVGMGLLLVTGLWVFTGYNLGVNAFGMGPRTAALTGLVLGVVAFSLDRMVLLANGGSTLLTAARSLIALLMAVIGGVGLDLWLLRSEIDQTLLTVHEGQAEERSIQVEARYAEELRKADEDVAQARMAKEEAIAAWVLEMNGHPSGTGRYGHGKVARAKEMLVNQRERELQEAIARQTAVQATAQQDRSVALDRLAIVQELPGLFDRLHAMHQYVFGDPLVLTAYLLISLVLVLLELSPLLIKLGARKTAYEEEVERADQMQRERTATMALVQQQLCARQRAMGQTEREAMARLRAITAEYHSLDQGWHAHGPGTRGPMHSIR